MEIVETGDGSVADAFRATLATPTRGGAALSIWSNGRPLVELASGVADDRSGRAFDVSTPSVACSCAKGIASLLIAMLVDGGEPPSCETRVGDLWPEFATFGKGDVSLEMNDEGRRKTLMAEMRHVLG